MRLSVCVAWAVFLSATASGAEAPRAPTGEAANTGARSTAAGTARVITYRRPTEAPASDAFTVAVEGKEVPLYRHGVVSYGAFDFDDAPVKVTVRVKGRLHSARLLPERLVRDVRVDRKQRTVTFRIPEPHSYVTLLLNGRYLGTILHLFANGIEAEPVEGPRENVLYFGPGYHKPDRGVVSVESGQTLYLAGGAYLNARVRATGAKNIAIRGRGVIAQHDDLPSRGHGVRLVDCKNVLLEGFIENKRQRGWSMCMDRCRNVTIQHLKVVTDAQPCTDGLNTRCGQDIIYRRCFFRTGDDCIAIKGLHTVEKYWELPANERILIEDCIMFTKHNGCISFGTETATAGYRDITVRNCDFLYQRGRNSKGWKAAIAIKMKFGTDIRDITFEDIRIGPHSQLMSLLIAPVIWRKGNLSRPGDIHDVTFRDITVSDAGRPDITLRGYDARHTIRDVTFQDLRVKGRLIENAADPIFLHNRYAAFECQGDASLDMGRSLVSPERCVDRSDNWADNWQKVCNDSVSDGEAFGADGEPVWAEFTLEAPTRIQSVQVHNDGRGPHRLGQWQVSCLVDGEWRDITGTRKAAGGWNRVAADDVLATKVRLVLNPPADGKVGCYEFACYGRPQPQGDGKD